MLKENKFKITLVVSIIVHILIGLLLSAYTLPKINFITEFTEITWGPSSNDLVSEISIEELEAGNPIEGSNQSSVITEKEIIDLPKSSSVGSDENYSTSKIKKNDDDRLIKSKIVTDKISSDENISTSISNSSTGDKNLKIGKEIESLDKDLKSIGKGSLSVGSGVNISYDIQWTNKIARNLERYNLPTYPKGVKVETQIKLKVYVEPNGFISDVQVLQKGNTLLENVAVNEVKKWKFEPLQSGHAQQIQTCVVSFKFKLR